MKLFNQIVQENLISKIQQNNTRFPIPTGCISSRPFSFSLSVPLSLALSLSADATSCLRAAFTDRICCNLAEQLIGMYNLRVCVSVYKREGREREPRMHPWWKGGGHLTLLPPRRCTLPQSRMKGKCSLALFVVCSLFRSCLVACARRCSHQNEIERKTNYVINESCFSYIFNVNYLLEGRGSGVRPPLPTVVSRRMFDKKVKERTDLGALPEDAAAERAASRCR